MVVSLGLGHCQGLLCIRGIKRVSFLVLAGHGWVLPGPPDCCRVDCAGMEGCSPFEPCCGLTTVASATYPDLRSSHNLGDLS